MKHFQLCLTLLFRDTPPRDLCIMTLAVVLSNQLKNSGHVFNFVKHFWCRKSQKPKRKIAKNKEVHK